MANDLTTVQPPGAMAPLHAADHIAVTISQLSNLLVDQHASVPTIERLPTAAERARLHERKQQIRSLIRPASEASAAQKRVSEAIGKMLGGWLNLRVGNVQEVIAGWTAKLQELPAWAICIICKELEEGTATFRDEKGQERKLSTEYAPSQATVYALARAKLDKLYAEAQLIERLMTAKLAAPTIAPEAQARVGALMADLAGSLSMRDAREREEARKTMRAEAKAAEDRAQQVIQDAARRRETEQTDER